MHSDQKSFSCIVDSLYHNPLLIIRMTQRKPYLKIEWKKSCNYFTNLESVKVVKFHTLFKYKNLDDNFKCFKAQINPHENKYFEKSSLKTDSKNCSPIELRLLQ